MDTELPLRADVDDVGRELLASTLLMLFALGSPGLLLGTVLGAVWLLG